MNHTLEAFFDAVSKLKLLVIGDVMLDHYIHGDADRISSEAPIPIVHASKDQYVAGGAANAALNAAGLGARVSIVGAIGQDVAGDTLKQVLEDKGVETEGLFSHEDRSTIEKIRVVAQRQQICRVDREGPPADYVLDEDTLQKLLPPDLCSSADVILISDYGKGLITDALLAHVRAITPAAALCVDPKPMGWNRTFSGAKILKPNRREALMFAGLDPLGPFDASRVIPALQERYDPEHLLITLGAEGMLLASRGQPDIRIETEAREVFDVSGAGDTVIAVASAAIGAGYSFEESAHLANAAAGVVVAHAGTFPITRVAWESIQ